MSIGALYSAHIVVEPILFTRRQHTTTTTTKNNIYIPTKQQRRKRQKNKTRENVAKKIKHEIEQKRSKTQE